MAGFELNQTIGAIVHRLCRLIWMILHQGIHHEERGPNRRRKVEASTHCENDPATPKSRLSGRTADCSTQYSMTKGRRIFDRADLS